MRRLFLSTFLLVVLGSTGARSEAKKGTESNPYQLSDSIIVSANRFGAEIKNIVWPFAVIKSTNLAGAVNLTEKLDGVAGIDIRQYSGVGSVSTLSSWGMHNRHMLLLYNGRIVRDMYLGGFNLSEFSADEFERIELVKGPQSAYYGSDAVGGVVNLVTPNSLADKLKVTGRFGSFGQKSIRVNLSRQFKPDHFGVKGFAQLNNTDNHRDNAGSENGLVGLRSDYLSSDGYHHFSFSVRYFEDSLGVPGPIPDPEAIPVYGSKTASSLTAWQEDKNISSDLRYTYQPDKKTQLIMNMFWERKKLHYFTRYNTTWPTVADVNSHSYYNERVGGASGHLRKTFSNIELSGGLDLLAASLRVQKNDTSFEANAQTITGVTWASPQTQWDIWSAASFQAVNWMAIDLSGRIQLIKSRTDQPSYNMGLVVNPTDQFSLKAGYGYAFRTPSIDQQFAQDWYRGNPKLSPETSRSMVASLAIYNLGRLSNIQFSLFHQTVDSLIQFYSDPLTWTTIYVNIDKFKTTGLDLSMAGNITDNSNFSFSTVIQKAEQSLDQPGQYVSANYVPNLKWRAELSGQLFNDLTWSSNLTYTSDRSIIMYGGQTKTISKVYEFGAGLAVEMFDNISLSLSGQDLTDEGRADQFGFTTTDGDYSSPGRRFLIEVSWGTN